MGQDDLTNEQQAAIRTSAERRMNTIRLLVYDLETAAKYSESIGLYLLLSEAANEIRQLAGME